MQRAGSEREIEPGESHLIYFKYFLFKIICVRNLHTRWRGKRRDRDEEKRTDKRSSADLCRGNMCKCETRTARRVEVVKTLNFINYGMWRVSESCRKTFRTFGFVWGRGEQSSSKCDCFRNLIENCASSPNVVQNVTQFWLFKSQN